MPTSVRLDPELEARLDAVALETGRSKASYIREAVESAIEDFEYECKVLKVLDDVRKGRESTYTLEEVGEMLGLED